MLKFFNRLEKTRNFVLLIFSVLMVASLVLFYAPTRGGADANLVHSTETAAKVAGTYITLGDLARQKEMYGQFSRGQSIPSKMLLDGAISDRIRRVEAERFGLTASDQEVANEITEQNKTPDGKPIEFDRYKEAMTERWGSVAAFEQQVRDELSSKKLQAFLTSGVTVSDDEVLKDFQRKNTKFDLSYVAVNSTDIAKNIVPTDQELQDYFEKNKATYYIDSPQKKIRYVFINTSKIGEKLQISDDDLKAEYDKLPADKKKIGVLGQEIVIRVPRPDQDAQQLEKASKLVEEMKKGGATVTEQVFADYAKGHSENAASAPLGGKLRGPVREDPNKPDDPYQRLLKMKVGEVTEPISYHSNYYILRRGDDVPKSFADAKKELEISLRNRRAYGVAAELAQKVADEFKQNHNAQKTAADFAAQANMSVGDMVRETGYVKPGDEVANIGVSPQFEDGILPLENVNDVGEKTPVKDGFAIPMLVDKKEPRDAEFAEVKSQVLEIVKLDKARSQVEELAKQIAAGAANAGALAGAASAKSLKAQDQKSFIIGSPLGTGPTASTNEALEDAIYAMKEGDVTKTPLKVGDNWYVVGVTKREDASMDDFAKQRDQLREQKLNEKRGEVFSDYIAATRQKMEANGSIRVYQEVAERLDGPPAGGMPTGFPGGMPGGIPGMPPGGAPGGAPGVPPGGSDDQ